jgi:hypothetical protein
MYAKGGRSKHGLALVLMMLAGIIVGSFIGELLYNVASAVPSVSFLKFLGYGHRTGFETVTVNLIAVVVSFGVEINFNICGVIFMIIAILIYRRL